MLAFSTAETWAFSLALVVVGASLAWVLVRGCQVDPMPEFDLQNEWHRQLVAWERDRLLGIAKAIASSAVGFTVTLLTVVLKNELAGDVSTVALLGCLLGVVGSLIAAATISLRATAYYRTKGTTAYSQPEKASSAAGTEMRSW